jgi:hypothetical protein
MVLTGNADDFKQFLSHQFSKIMHVTSVCLVHVASSIGAMHKTSHTRVVRQESEMRQMEIEVL